MSTYPLLSSWVCPILFSCLAATAACSSSSDDANSNAGASSVAGASNGGSPGASAGSSNVAGAAVAGSAAGGAPGQAGAGGAVAQAGASSGGTSAGGSAGGSAAGSNAGGASGSAGSATGGASNGGSGSGGASTGAFALTSPAWTAMANCSADAKTSCPIFPKENIGTSIGGSNKSPELDWTAGPSGTQSYAIVLQDLTNITMGKPFVHWVMWNIPAATRMLPAGLETTAMPSVPAGSSQKSFGGNGYQGSGKCGNVYEFVLYALPTATYAGSTTNQTAVRDGLVATNAPTATLRARSGAPGCTE